MPYDQDIQMKPICSNEADFRRKLVDLKFWLTDLTGLQILRPEI